MIIKVNMRVGDLCLSSQKSCEKVLKLVLIDIGMILSYTFVLSFIRLIAEDAVAASTLIELQI